jgi:hypothetical protein
LGFTITCESDECMEQKVSVLCSVGDVGPIPICRLIPEKMECCIINLEFEENEDVIFSVYGNQKVYLSVYYVSFGQNACCNQNQNIVRKDFEIIVVDSERSVCENHTINSFLLDIKGEATTNQGIKSVKESRDGKILYTCSEYI